MIGTSNYETNFSHKLLLTIRQVANVCTAFANFLSTHIKLSKTQLFKMIQSGGFLSKLLGSKFGLPLMRNVINPLAKSDLIPLGLTAAASAEDARKHKNILGSGTTTLIISIDEMEDIIIIVKSLEDSGLLLKGVSETIQNKAKEQKGKFLSMLLGTLCPNLLRNMLTGKGINNAGEAMIRPGYGSKSF